MGWKRTTRDDNDFTLCNGNDRRAARDVDNNHKEAIKNNIVKVVLHKG